MTFNATILATPLKDGAIRVNPADALMHVYPFDAVQVGNEGLLFRCETSYSDKNNVPVKTISMIKVYINGYAAEQYLDLHGGLLIEGDNQVPKSMQYIIVGKVLSNEGKGSPTIKEVNGVPRSLYEIEATQIVPCGFVPVLEQAGEHSPGLFQTNGVGLVYQDVELKQGQSGTQFANIKMACSRSKNDVCFVEFTLFGKRAETASTYIRKDSYISFSGELEIDQGKDGNAPANPYGPVLWGRQDGTVGASFRLKNVQWSFAGTKTTGGGGGDNRLVGQPAAGGTTPSNVINEDEIPF